MGKLPNPKSLDNKLVTLARIMQTLREEKDITVLIQTTLDYLVQEFDYRLVWLGLYDRLEHRLEGKGGKTPNDNPAFLQQRFGINSGDVFEQLVIQQRPVAVADLRREGRAGEWQSFAQKVGIQGTLLFPLRHQDRCFGVVLLGSHLWGVSPRTGEKAQLTMLFGGLATALYEIEVEWQHQAMKHPEEPLFEVLAQLQSSDTLGQRLSQVVRITHEFIAPSRTNLYGYSAQKRCFWQRLSNRQNTRGYRSSAPELRGQDVYDFYRLLSSGQLVAVGTSRSPLRPETTKELMSHLKARSLLAAPILVYDELVGFLSVEDKNARIWESAEQKFISSVAKAIALVMAGEEVGTKLEQAKADVGFAADVTQTFARYDHPQNALGECAALLCQKLSVNRFWLLQAAEENKGELLLASKSTSTMPYRSFYHYTAKRRQNSEEEYPLRVKDWYEIRKGTTGTSATGSTYAIDDLEVDERLASSRKILLNIGIKSLIACPVGNENSGGVLLLAHNNARTWTAADIRLASFIAPQLSWILKLSLQRKEVSAIAQLQTTLQNGLTYLWESLQTQTFEQKWLEYLAQLLDTPVAFLLTWDANASEAKVATVLGLPQFDHQQRIPRQDPLIQATVNSEGFYTPQPQDLNASWLKLIPTDQVLTLALRLPNSSATGLILFADVKQRHWSDPLLEVVATLVREFTQVYHYLAQLPQAAETQQPSTMLNWYKHRALGILHQATVASRDTLPILETVTSQDTTQIQSESQVRQQQTLRHLDNTLSDMLTVVTEETQNLIPHFSAIPLSNLLKECLYTVESRYKQKQLVTKIYSLGSFQISSDRVKIACVLVELLDHAARNAPQQSQVELWYRPLGSKSEDNSASFIELSLIEPHQPLTETANSSKPSPPWQIPVTTAQTNSTTLHFCQDMLVLLKGRLQFYQLKDRRFLNRLILPIA